MHRSCLALDITSQLCLLVWFEVFPNQVSPAPPEEGGMHSGAVCIPCYSEPQSLPACERVRWKVLEGGPCCFLQAEKGIGDGTYIDDDREQRRAGRVSQVQPSLGGQRVLVLPYKRALSSALYQVYLSKE